MLGLLAACAVAVATPGGSERALKDCRASGLSIVYLYARASECSFDVFCAC